MMRELSKKKLGLAVAAGLGLMAAGSAANAATITFKLVPTDSTVVQNAGDVVHFNVIASVQSGDTSSANDGYLQGAFSVTSTESAAPAGALGDVVPLTLNTTQANGSNGVLDGSVSQAGTQANLDGNPDLELGSNNGASTAGFVIANAGTSTKLGSGTTLTGTTDFLLGTGSWTYAGGDNAGATTNLGIAMRLNPSNLASGRTVQFTSDGTAYAVKGDGSNSNPAGAVVATQGFTVTVAGVPEPTSLGLLGLGAMGLLTRRRRNA